uniref:Zinc finger CCCH domain-containing protein 10 n=1 Tax=Magallana gigas TaxID=29159 RepID=A0A8W8MQ35_MAGGI
MRGKPSAQIYYRITKGGTSTNVSLTSGSMQQTLPPVVSMTQTMPQNLQGPPSAPLVSYPIVSQNMRAAPSSLAH